jgi:hypothetical protein
MQKIWFLLFLCLLICANLNEKINNSILGCVQSLTKVCLLSNKLNGIFFKECHIFMSNHYSRYDNFKKYGLDKWIENLHSYRELCWLMHKFQCEVKSFWSNEVCLSFKNLLQMRFKQRNGKGFLKSLWEFNKLVINPWCITILRKQSIGYFGWYSFKFPLNMLISCINFIHIFCKDLKFCRNRLI